MDRYDVMMSRKTFDKAAEQATDRLIDFLSDGGIRLALAGFGLLGLFVTYQLAV